MSVKNVEKRLDFFILLCYNTMLVDSVSRE